MDEDGDLTQEDDLKPASKYVFPTPSHSTQEIEEGVGGGGGVLREEGKEDEMAGENVDDEDIEEEEEEGYRLIMDEERDDADDDDENGDEHNMSHEEIADDGNGLVHDDDDDDDDEEEEEEGDTTDGGPPQLENMSTVTEQVMKRPHVQSKRMQEYQAMQQMTHTASRVFVCPESRCRRVFNSAPGLRYHVKQTHQDCLESFICDICRKEFKSLNGLKYHRKKKRCQSYVKGDNSTDNPSIGEASASPDGGGYPRVPPPPLILHHPSPTTTTTTTTTAPTTPTATQTLTPTPITHTHTHTHSRDECPAPRLLDLAHIATGPQSPLLQGLSGSASVGASFFDSPEKNAVMALSSMAQKRSSRGSTSEDPPDEGMSGMGLGLGVGVGSEPSDPPPGHHATAPPPPIKSKRPMNGFMLFAKKNRAEFTKMYPHTNNRMISTKLSEEWTKLPDVERQRWKEDARLMAEVQRSKHPDCWKRKKYSSTSKDRN